jgi:hypothetical protein
MLPPAAVVRVSSVQEQPDFDRPWQAPNTETARDLGVVVGRNLVLTSAEVAARAIEVLVWRQGDSVGAPARIKAVHHDLDLALVETELVRHIRPVELGAMPHTGDRVDVATFETLVPGAVTKIDTPRYVHSQRYAPALTVDHGAPLDAGGAAFVDGALVGFAIQKPNDEAVSEMVPAPVVAAFLRGVTLGRPAQLPSLGARTQNLENPALRNYLGLIEEHEGVVVVHVDHGESADGVLQRDDVVTAIDGHPIANTGVIDYHGARVRIDAVLATHHVGDLLPLAIRRRGQPMSVELALTRWQPLVPRSQYDGRPAYYIFGGLVFQRLTRDYLTTWETWWNQGPKEFLDYYYRGDRTRERHEVVILTQILDDGINAGYAHLYNEAIAAIDGELPRDFAAFVDRLSRATGIVRIDTTSAGMIVLDAAQARAANARILARHDIPADRG